MFNKLIRKLPIHQRWALALKIMPLVFGVVILKLISHNLNFEILALSSLFTAIISTNIFLISFLISGVLVDYKESEKIPGEIASSMENMADEATIIFKKTGNKIAKEFLGKLLEFNKSLLDWFHKREKTENIMKSLFDFNDYFLEFEKITESGFISRLRQDQHNLRRMITRVHAIRETSFLGTGYAIVEIITSILIIGMIFVKIEPFYESLFFVSFVSFILIYMIRFIKDLDNPFGYAIEENMVEDVPLKPIVGSKQRIESYYQSE